MAIFTDQAAQAALAASALSSRLRCSECCAYSVALLLDSQLTKNKRVFERGFMVALETS
jgi:hypothetical protein